MDPILRLITQLRPVIPPTMRVLVLADRGLWSPRLWDGIRAAGWHPLLRIQQHAISPGPGSHAAPPAGWCSPARRGLDAANSAIPKPGASP